MRLTARRYYCPWCQTALQEEDGELLTKWALLIPQKTSGSTEICCINCQRTNIVVRQVCSNVDCNGNVLFEGEYGLQCLVCFSDQDETS